MTTKALVETVMNYPLLLDLLASNSPDNGFGNMVKNFNGLQELITREDAGQYLNNFYLKDSKVMICFDIIRLMDMILFIII